MKREIITIGENGKVHIPTTPVWMSACEIADLFDVFSGKEGLLREDEVMQTLLFKGGAVDLYNIEMIMMLSFRFVSPHAQLFRKWAIRKLTQKKSTTPLLVCYNKDGWYS